MSKLVLSGYTGNILINDPFLSQMFIIYFLLLTTLGIVLALRILRHKQPEILFYNSIIFRIFIFSFG